MDLSLLKSKKDFMGMGLPDFREGQVEKMGIKLKELFLNKF